MIEWFLEGGFFMWLVLVAGLIGLALAIDTGRRLAYGESPTGELQGEIDAVLFWGVFASVLGTIGTLGGVGQMARYAERAGEMSAPVAWSGLRVALITTVFGLIVLALCLLAWFALRTALLRRDSG